MKEAVNEKAGDPASTSRKMMKELKDREIHNPCAFLKKSFLWRLIEKVLKPVEGSFQELGASKWHLVWSRWGYYKRFGVLKGGSS